MFFLKKIGCRLFQLCFKAALPVLPYREPILVDNCENLDIVFKNEGIKSVLVVTDKGIVDSGVSKRVEDVLCNCSVKYVLYDKTQPNPTVDNVEEALKIYYENKCECLVAIGGGSSMDCAKAIGARVAYPRRSLDSLKGILRIHRKLPTLVAIPTTAGTGSEVTLAAIITDSRKHQKYALMSFPLIPHYAVLDATLTYTLPPHMTSTTGMDALTHAVEAYIGRSTSIETRSLAKDAVKLVFENVKTAYNDGTNKYARDNMLNASYKAGIAFSKSYVGYVHAVAHSLGGKYGIPHGLANAVILPYFLEAYGKSIHKKLYQLGISAGICDKNDSHAVGAEKFIDAVKMLNKDMGIPEKLKGIKREDIAEMARLAEREANPLYPVPVLMTRKQLEKFYYEIADWSEE